MSRPIWMVKLIEIGFPLRFMLARLTRLPLLDRAFERWLFEKDDIIYVPKDRVVSVNQDLEPPGQTVLPSEVIHRFIDTANYHWVMNFCICRESSNCKDYPQSLGCLFMGKAVLGINPALGKLVSKEEAHEHIRRCNEKGLFHLVGRNKLDTVWLGVGPGENLLTVCNCCPCCCLWRFMPFINPQIAGKITRMPGVCVEVTEACTGCGTCQTACFIGKISLVEGRSMIAEGCVGCGHCVEICPNHAIKLSVNDNLYVDRSVERLVRVVSVE